MRTKAQRRKNTRRIIRQRERFFKEWGFTNARELHQRNRLSKIDFNLGTKKDYPDSTKPTISEQRKIDKMNDLDE